MAYPWQRLDGEPDDAYEAFIAYHRNNGHLETDTDKLLNKAPNQEWVDKWQWDDRCAAWDAETDRRRIVNMARGQNIAANTLVALAAGSLELADPKATDEETIERLQIALQIASDLFMASLSVVKEYTPASPETPTAPKPTRRKTTKRTKRKTVATEAETETPLAEEPPAEQGDKPETIDTNEPSLKQPEDSPPPDEELSKSQSEPAPQPEENEQPTSKLKAPTEGTRCGQRGGLTDHGKRGERPCEACEAYRSKKPAIPVITPQSQQPPSGSTGTSTKRPGGKLAPVILKPVPGRGKSS